MAPMLQARRPLRGRRAQAHGRRHRGGRRAGRGPAGHRQPLRGREHPARRLPEQRAQGQGAVQARQGLHRQRTARCSSSTSSPGACSPAAATTRACTRPSRPRRAWRSRPRTRPWPPSPCRTTSGSTPSSSGMTGTAQTEAAELHQIYKMGVRADPDEQADGPRRPVRPHLQDRGGEVRRGRRRTSPRSTPRASRCWSAPPASRSPSTCRSCCVQLQVPHEVLNAKQHAREARDRRPGRARRRGHGRHEHGRPRHRHRARRQPRVPRRPGAARAAAWTRWRRREEYEAAWDDARRGGEGRRSRPRPRRSREAGGLYVLGTERHESRRIDNQLRGRSGRQGDPGESRFYLSLGDELMRRFNGRSSSRS